VKAPVRPTLELRGVGVVRDGCRILDGVDWRVVPEERWVVLGANGSGKTTLLRVASLYLHPTEGSVTVLGGTLGRTDVRSLRTRVGLASQAFADLLHPEVTVVDVVMTAKHAALEPWWHTYDDADRDRARGMLERLGVDRLGDRPFGTLSSGERQRVQLARTLMADPGLVLLDEPTAGLDLGGREDLVDRLANLAADPTLAPVVLVTHHVEEIPAGFTHLLVLRAGRLLAAGPLPANLTADVLSTAFDIDLDLDFDPAHGRWRAWRRR
jgi:iron complex transport system ATP-binding protein